MNAILVVDASRASPEGAKTQAYEPEGPPVELVQSNLLTPMVLAFVLSALAVRAGSDLKLPDAIYSDLSIYLFFAIGLKGGAALAEASLDEIAVPAIAPVLLGFSRRWHA